MTGTLAEGEEGCGLQMVQQASNASESAMQMSARASLTDSEFEAISRDVAARIIQTHWHCYQQRGQQQVQQQQQLWDAGEVWRQEQLCQLSTSLMALLDRPEDSSCSPPAQDSSSSAVLPPQQVAASPAHMQSGTQPELDADHQGTLQLLPQVTQHTCLAGPAGRGSADVGTTHVAAAAAAELVPTPLGVAEGYSSSSEQVGLPAAGAAAFGKLRAAAGSRNAARLQQYAAAAVTATSPADVHNRAAQDAVSAVACRSPVADSSVGGPPLVQQPTGHPATELVVNSAASSQGGEHTLASAGLQCISTTVPAHSSKQELGAAGTDKLSTILAYLDAVEAHAGQDAAAGTSPPLIRPLR